MSSLILGLVVFLGVHSTRIFAEPWRAKRIAEMGEGKWKGLYSLASLAGLVLIVYGYGEARADPVMLWNPPVWTRHLASLLTLPAFVLLTAAYVPGNNIKAKIGHPMVAGVMLWAFAHLIANGTLADFLLFGSFLVWAAADFISSRRRDRVAGVRYAAGAAARDAMTVIIGLVAWAVFAFWLHARWIGVQPFG